MQYVKFSVLNMYCLTRMDESQEDDSCLSVQTVVTEALYLFPVPVSYCWISDGSADEANVGPNQHISNQSVSGK